MLLKSEGEVTVAANVDEALKAVAQQTPDVILLDLVMPGRSGLELLAELKERDVRAPVIVLNLVRGFFGAGFRLLYTPAWTS